MAKNKNKTGQQQPQPQQSKKKQNLQSQSLKQKQQQRQKEKRKELLAVDDQLFDSDLGIDLSAIPLDDTPQFQRQGQKEKQAANGICSICGKFKKMTYEHIPPRSAFNSSTVILPALRKGEKHSDMGQMHTPPKQGFGLYSLCESCNQNMGAFYVNDYSNFSRALLYHACQLYHQGNDAYFGEWNLNISEFYPLRVYKEIIAMFCSLAGYRPVGEAFREFLLNKVARVNPSSQSTKDGKWIVRLYHNVGMSPMYTHCHSLACTLPSGLVVPVPYLEIATVPIGLVLYHKPPGDYDPFESRGVNINSFAEYRFETKADMNITIPPGRFFAADETTAMKELLGRPTQEDAVLESLFGENLPDDVVLLEGIFDRTRIKAKGEIGCEELFDA